MASAEIIPFPVAAEPAPEVRLADALGALQDALEAQRKAVAEWRFAMAELGIGVAGLNQSLLAYRSALDVVDEKVGGLRGQASALEGWADGVLGREGASDAQGV
jgi:hypothetical protein